MVAGLLLTTCGPTGGEELAAGPGLTGGGSLDELAPEAAPEARARAFALSDRDGNGKLDPAELDAFFAALARSDDPPAEGPTTTVPAFVPPGVVLPPVATDDPTLFMVGDSVLQASYPTVQAMLPSWSVLADTRIGRRVAEGAAVVEDHESQIGDVAVIVLGHNYAAGEGFSEQFSRIMRQLWDVERVVWVTVAEWSPGQREVNAILRAAPEVWSNVVVADWAALAAANPGYLVSDRVHLTSAGVLAISDLMARAIGPGPIEGVPGIVTVNVPEGPGGPPDYDDDPVPTVTRPRSTTTIIRTTTSTTAAPVSTTVPVSTTLPVTTTVPVTTTEPTATTEPPTTEPQVSKAR